MEDSEVSGDLVAVAACVVFFAAIFGFAIYVGKNK